MNATRFAKRALAMATLAVGVTAAASACIPTTPSLRVSDVTVAESGGQAAVTVTLSTPSVRPVTAHWNTLAGTATPADYTQRSGVLTIPAGSTRVTLTVPIVSDALDEYEEQFRLGLYSASGATLADADGVATITDDDAPPTVSITSRPIFDERDGTSDWPFRFGLSAVSAKEVSFRFRTTDGPFDTVSGTATAGSDYRSVDQVLTIPAGERTTSVLASSFDDALDEGIDDPVAGNVDHESFTGAISAPTNASLGQYHSVSTPILDDDDPPTISVTDARTLVEADADLAFTVELSAPSGRNVDFRWATEDGSAEAGVDYVAGSGLVRLDPGQTTVPVTVRALEDECRELQEDLYVDLTDVRHTTIADGQGRARITDDVDEELC